MTKLWRLAGGVTAALLIGTFAGNAAVSGMVGLDRSYAPPAAGTDAIAMAQARDDSAVTDASPFETPTAYRTDADRRDGGDYAAGWKSAEKRDLRDDSTCHDESWSFNRGCIAYVTGGTPPAA